MLVRKCSWGVTTSLVVEMNSGTGGGGTGLRSPFTVSQWQELEHQALIFKYMMAGLPVPPDLVLPIQKSFESISHRFFHHPTSKPIYLPFSPLLSLIFLFSSLHIKGWITLLTVCDLISGIIIIIFRGCFIVYETKKTMLFLKSSRICFGYMISTYKHFGLAFLLGL